MTKQTITRRARFRAALAIAGMTQHDWAREHSISPAYVSLLLSGQRGGEKYTDLMNSYIAEYEKKAAKRYADIFPSRIRTTK